MRDLPPLYILRHGETTWNREGRCQGHLDAPLTALGRAQAAQQGRIIADHILPLHPDIPVWVSPLGRAQATWAIAAEAAGLASRAFKSEPRLAEVHMGDWQGRLRADFLAEDPVARTHPNLFELSLNTPGGETYEALRSRLVECLHQVNQPTICVTHGITSLVLRGLILELSREEMADLGHDQGIVYCLNEGAEHRLEAPSQK
ncbi:histidine phosphatase family protein [Rhodobacteraceae bacterium M385]|nr:histidine phosphatase family protein [Rhodobacteraceae bacterium M385]